MHHAKLIYEAPPSNVALLLLVALRRFGGSVYHINIGMSNKDNILLASACSDWIKNPVNLSINLFAALVGLMHKRYQL